MRSNFFKVARKLDCQTWVAQWDKIKVTDVKGLMDIRGFQLDGFTCEAALLDVHPVSGRQLKQSRWFIFATAI